jgi:hypothetical protein
MTGILRGFEQNKAVAHTYVPDNEMDSSFTFPSQRRWGYGSQNARVYRRIIVLM